MLDKSQNLSGKRKADLYVPENADAGVPGRLPDQHLPQDCT